MGCVTKGSSSVSENGGFLPSNLWQFQWGQLINYSELGTPHFQINSFGSISGVKGCRQIGLIERKKNLEAQQNAPDLCTFRLSFLQRVDPRKLNVYSSLDLIALERRCRNRGLFGSGSSSKSLLLRRLRIFEEYWAQRSKDDVRDTPQAPEPVAPKPVAPEPVAEPLAVPLEAGDDLDGVPLEVERSAV